MKLKEILCERRKDRVDRFFDKLPRSNEIKNIVNQMNSMVSKNDIAFVDEVIASQFKGKKINQMTDDELFDFATELYNIIGNRPMFKKLMKEFLNESLITRYDLKKDKKKEQMAIKAVDLKPFLDQIKSAKTTEDKKAIAKEMAQHFKVGGKESFLHSLEKCASSGDVDRLCYMAALKGEGMGVGKK